MTQPSQENPRAAALLDQLIHEYLQQVDEGRAPDRGAMLREHPELAGDLAAFFDDQDRIARFAQRLRLEETVGLASDREHAAKSSAASTGGLPGSIRYFGRYEILEEIARGGMGVVYKARQSRLDRVVALKMILTGQLASNADVARFYSEAQAAANLEHSGIVPIYEVGQYAGQHYFSMAYVEGESLATVLARGPLPQREAAIVVRQLCEAVHYAHGRGVIHRDLKPANVLIDADGRPRITDFGLAKQAGANSGLTATGQVLGTPSFMPPEQAAGELAAVGKAADIYSLGAVLYATLTGRPPFQAATPVDTLLQVRNADPVPPRLLNPAISRDLETICLKCLEKDPERRYASAAAMAEDLRRYLADEPILARRLGPFTLGVRWIRKRQKTVLLVCGSVAAAVAVVVVSFLAARAHERAQIGRLSITTDGPTLVAELLDKDGHPAAASFPIPSSAPVELPGGSYTARFSSPGIMSETYSVEIPRGETVGMEVRLEDRSLWPPMEMTPGDFIELVAFPGRGAGLLRYRGPDAAFRLLDGATGKPVWPQDLALDKNNLPPGADADEWPTLLGSGTPWQVPPYAILEHGKDGDDTFIFGSRRRPALIAVAAKTGKVLWLFRGVPTVKAGTDLARFVGGNLSPIIGKPIIAMGTDNGPITIAAFFSTGESFEISAGKGVTAEEEIWLEAVSAKTGKSLWRHTLQKPGTSIAPWEALPIALEALEQPQIVKVGERVIVVTANEKRLYGFDLATGKEAWPPLDLGFAPDVAPKIVPGADGTSGPIAVFVSGRPRTGSFVTPVKLTLTGISLTDRRQLWQAAIDGFPPKSMPHDSPDDPPEFELAPIGPSGAPAIVARVSPAKSQGSNSGETALTVIDPTSGKVRWSRTLLRTHEMPLAPVVRWAAGPDLDGDGYPELFAAWVGYDYYNGAQLLATAFSGRDGRTLWRWTQPGVGARDLPPAELCWWTPTESGRPQLVVPAPTAMNGQGATYILDSADGRLREILPEVSDPHSADLDGDGLPDLYYAVKPQGYARLMTVRGAPPVAWRRLCAGQLQAAGDFDSDGIDDLLAPQSNIDLVALSGRDGGLLWRSHDLTRYSDRVELVPPLVSDSDGKSPGRGAAAILLTDHTWFGANNVRLRALSGRDGREIWRQPDSALHGLSFNYSAGTSGSHWYNYPASGAIYLHPDAPDIWSANGGQSNLLPIWLTVLSGANGKVKWQAPVAFGQFGQPGQIFQSEFGDLDGDGVADVVAWTIPQGGPPNSMQLAAFSGADGKRLWTGAPAIYCPLPQNNGDIDLPVAADLDGKGQPDVLFVRPMPPDNNSAGAPCELVAVSGKTGRVKWTWQWHNVGVPLLPPLAVAFDGPGPRSVCLQVTEVLPRKGGGTVFQPELIVLNHDGTLRRRIELASSAGSDPHSFWRKADLRGDGKEVLLLYDSTYVKTFGGDGPEPIWQWAVQDPSAKLLEILPSRKSAPATIAVWANKSVYGVSGLDGQLAWRGEMTSGPPTSSAFDTSRMLLHDDSGLRLPRLLAGNSCRLTWPTDESGRYSPPPVMPRAYETVPDPVRTRLLPWVPPRDSDESMTGLLALWALVWLVVPWQLLRWSIRRNSWWLAFLPAVYQLATVLTLRLIPAEWLPAIPSAGRFDAHFVVAVFTLFFLVANIVVRKGRRLWLMLDASVIYAIAIAIAWPRAGGGEGPNGSTIGPDFTELFPVLLVGLPLIAAVWLPAAWIKRGQWRRLGVFVIAILILAGATAAFQLLVPRPWKQTDEPYALDGWWWIFGWGLYFAALLTLLTWFAKTAFRSCRNVVGAMIRRLRRPKS